MYESLQLYPNQVQRLLAAVSVAFFVVSIALAQYVAKSTPKDSIFLNILNLWKSKMWEGVVLLVPAELWYLDPARFVVYEECRCVLA